ncbi:CaiB/BaiF CoA transferase family protein [[Mycobacterium] zoologicum]|uniref:CaiB/BaiF CoA transferase family protein n=1 Tax=[Mycobacterium] zoologicum TaxID=2872311 RepID=UPI001CDADC5E|nr:CaiB/BaiF CoA-transferase family protein [Mycolicibacter sp. MYC101]MEB3062732.1 CaiB/BaiF CoA-transferase family protein [Mycolicibacter sp. MYC101]
MIDAPLAGITVVGIEQAVAAPYATRQLADLGARVIKIERPGGGDFARGYDRTVYGDSSYFVWLNRGKESLTLDLKHAEGQGVVRRLLDGADVLVHNLGPGAAARMGLDAAAMTKSNPELVVCTITGYGNDGPWSQRKAYDLLVQAEAGLLSSTGSPEEVARAGISVADIAAGMFAYSGVLTALYMRATTGQVTPVSVSLFDALAEWMGQPMYYSHYGTGTPLQRTGARHATIAPYGPFTAGDGRTVLLAVQNQPEWRRLCEDVLGRPELVNDPRFAENPDRLAHRDELESIIAAAITKFTAAEFELRLEKARVANARINKPDQLWNHPALAERDRRRPFRAPGGMVEGLLPPATLAGVDVPVGDVPALGAHSADILRELGYSPHDIDDLVRQRVTTLGDAPTN